MKNNLNKILIGVGFAFFLILLLFAGINSSSEEKTVYRESSRRVVMGTFARFVIAAEDPHRVEKIIETGFDELVKVEELMSDYDPDSEISRVNREAYQRPVKVSRASYSVLKKSIEYSELTDGAFDITVGGLVQLWRKVKDSNTPVTEEQITRAGEAVGWENLILNDRQRTVRFKKEGMRIDLGGIAKGYAIDKAVDAMKNEGAMGGIVDVGGDVRCFGKLPGNRKYWQVAIQNPRPSGKDNTLITLRIKSGAVATSGDYRRFYEKAGQKYSHIIDPNKNWSSQGPSSVTVIAKTAIRADVFATAVSVMGTGKGLDFINSRDNAEAIIVETSDDGATRIFKSTKAQGYIK